MGNIAEIIRMIKIGLGTEVIKETGIMAMIETGDPTKIRKGEIIEIKAEKQISTVISQEIRILAQRAPIGNNPTPKTTTPYPPVDTGNLVTQIPTTSMNQTQNHMDQNTQKGMKIGVTLDLQALVQEIENIHAQGQIKKRIQK